MFKIRSPVATIALGKVSKHTCATVNPGDPNEHYDLTVMYTISITVSFRGSSYYVSSETGPTSLET